MSNQPLRRKSNRQGAFVVGVILVMIVVATLVMAFTRSLVNQSRASRTQWKHRQAAWIAESGLSRGAARLETDQEYAGETWNLPSDQIAGGAEIVIEVDPVAEEPQVKHLRVVAKYPLNSKTPATVEATLQIHTSNRETKSE